MLLIYQLRLEDKGGMSYYFLVFSFSFHAVIKRNQSMDFSISQLWIFQRCIFPFSLFPGKHTEFLKHLSNVLVELFTFILKNVCRECKLKILLSLSEGFSFSHIWLVCKHSKSHFNNLSDNILFDMYLSVWINISWTWTLYWFCNWVYLADIKITSVHPHNICSQNSVTF